MRNVSAKLNVQNMNVTIKDLHSQVWFENPDKSGVFMSGVCDSIKESPNQVRVPKIICIAPIGWIYQLLVVTPHLRQTWRCIQFL